MADEEPAEPAAEPEPKPLFGGKQAPLFKKKGAGKKFFDDHKLAVISTLVAIIGLIYLVVHNRAAQSSTSANVSGQGTAANNAPTSSTGTAPSPYDFQPWWTGDGAGGGGGGISTTPPPPGGTATPPTKHATAPAAKSAAKPQPSSHPASSPATPHPAAASVAASPGVHIMAGLYAPLSPSSSPVHRVAPTEHPESHVAVGASHVPGSASNVLVPFTYRSGVPAPSAHLTEHVGAPAKRPAGRRMAGRA